MSAEETIATVESPFTIDTPLLEITERGSVSYSVPSAAVSMAALPSAAKSYESADLDRAECETLRIADRAQSRTARFLFYAKRWFLTTVVALLAALLALAMHEGGLWGRNLNNYLSRKAITSSGSQALGGLTYVVVGTLYVVLAGIFILVFDPHSRGSATEVLSYLNGLIVSKTFSIRNLFAHATALTFVTASPMCVGREGPMLAIGAQCGGAVARLGNFEESESRNFVSCGLGAGIACAFGAPAGAVLFTLEKGFHFSLGFLRRLLFTSMASTFVLSLLLTGFDEWQWGEIGLDSLCHFGQFSSRIYALKQVLAWVAMGVFGGLLGALFNLLHILAIRFKRWMFPTPSRRFVELVILAVLTGTVAVAMSALFPHCTPLPGDGGSSSSSGGGIVVSVDSDLQRGFCPEGTYSQMATLFLNQQESAMHWLFHESSVVSY